MKSWKRKAEQQDDAKESSESGSVSPTHSLHIGCEFSSQQSK